MQVLNNRDLHLDAYKDDEINEETGDKIGIDGKEAQIHDSLMFMHRTTAQGVARPCAPFAGPPEKSTGQEMFHTSTE